MKVYFPLKYRPAFVFVSDFLSFGKKGWSFACFMVLNRKFAEDKAVLAHELVHVRQAYQGWFVGTGIMWLISDDYRLNIEVEGYAMETFVDGGRDHLSHFAEVINLKYWRMKKYSIEEILRRLDREYQRLLNRNLC